MEMFIILIALLVFFMLLGMPVAYSLGTTSIIAYLMYVSQVPGREFCAGLIAQRVVDGVNSFPLLAIPLFLFAGRLMNEGGITERIFRLANDFVGRFKGGLGYVNVVASLIFSGMSGAAVADVVGLGSLEIKAMRDAGYDIPFSCAITGASSIVGPIIPPSIPMLVYGVLAGVSIGKLFLGGIIPGLLMGFSLMGMISILSYIRGYPVGTQTSIKEKLISLKHALLSLLTPVIIIGGIWSGVFTPSEAAGIASVYAIFLCCIVYRIVNLQKLLNIAKKSVIDSVSILFILACASFYSTILTMLRIPYILGEELLLITADPLTILIIINIFLIIIGCFLPAMVSIYIFTPILVPMVTSIGIDPIFFGVLMILNLMIGMLTPPYGMVLFALTKVSDIPLERVIKEMILFILPLILILVLMIIYPRLVTFIPHELVR